MESLISISAMVGGLAYLVIAIVYSLILRKYGVIFLPAFLFSAIWSIVSWRFFAMDFIYALVWSSCFLLIFDRHHQLTRFSLRWYLIWSIPSIALIGAIDSIFIMALPAQVSLYLYLLCCIGTLLIAEQHIRNSRGLIRTISIGIGALFLFNLYLYSNALIGGYISPDITQARSLANTTVGLLLCFAPLTFSRVEYQRIKLELSRPMVFTTTSLVMAGAILLFVSILGYLLSIGNSEYTSIIQPFFLFLGVLFIGLILASSTRRAMIRVWVYKNFFQTKYDYNDEWRRLSGRLSPVSSDEDYASVAIRAVLPIYNGTGGACYINQGGRYIPEFKINISDELNPIKDSDSPAFFQKMLQDNWIFVPAATDPNLTRFNHLLPENLARVDSTLLVLPLINDERLIGFLTISADLQQAEDFNWEDLDLLRMVLKQVANFVGNQMLASELVVTRQFDAYNQFTTFVMHDLKNLIAQQALVVENAGRFSDNPEFVADAIKTIENSVEKMNRLILRINETNPAHLKQSQPQPISLIDALNSAIDKCSAKEPKPVLHPGDKTLLVDADIDNLVMAFTHLLTNAQEACAQDGKIDIYLKRINGSIECKIIDNGVGMDQEFIDRRLFKPFDSTKKNKGMGIGAYQCRQIISNIGGAISVNSKRGEGSCFTVILSLSS